MKEKFDQAMQVAEKRKEILEFFDLAVKDWKGMSLENQKRVLDRIKFDVPDLRVEERELLRNKLTESGIVTEERFDNLVKKGCETMGIPLLEDKGYSVDTVNQRKLDKLLEAAIPKTGFIKKYIDTFSEITDTPKTFLFWGALIAIATVLGKSVFIPWEARRLYPNIWAVFLAPSGFRKGTGIDIPTHLLREIDPDLLLPQVASEEGLTKALATEEEGHEVGFVRWQEFSKILRSWLNKQSWQASQEFWINIWDNKETKKKLSGGEFNIPVTSISFLSACTPKTFSTFFAPEDLEGGFFGRVYLITCIKKGKYFPIPPSIESSDKRKRAEGEVIQELKDIKLYFTGGCSYKEFEDGFSHWAKETQKNHKAGFLDSFYSRIETHCMKLAMLFEAATTKNKKITQQSFELAVNAIEFLIASASPLVSEEIGLDEAEKKVCKIAKYIQERGEVDKSEVMRNLHLRSFDMENIEKTLIERALIEVRREAPAAHGQRKKIYFWASNTFGGHE